jgi:hypothetical protein
MQPYFSSIPTTMSQPSPLRRILTNLNEDESPMVTIQCNGDIVEARKNLLSAVSDVFKVMLRSDMIEKRTNVVTADDVYFETMKFIIDYYNIGNIGDFKNSLETLDKEQFTYIVDKYSFLAIKEDFTEIIFQEYLKTNDIEILGCVFFPFESQFYKFKAMVEVVTIVARNEWEPTFLSHLNIPDFLGFSRLYCEIYCSLGFRFTVHRLFTEILRVWYSKDPENRINTLLSIIQMMFPKPNPYSCSEEKQLLRYFLTFPKFEGLKKLGENSLK